MRTYLYWKKEGGGTALDITAMIDDCISLEPSIHRMVIITRLHDILHADGVLLYPSEERLIKEHPDLVIYKGIGGELH